MHPLRTPSQEGLLTGLAYTEATQGQTIIPNQPLHQFTVTAVITLQAPWNGRIFDKISAGGVDGWLLDVYPENNVRVISNGSTISSSVKLNNTPTYLAVTYGLPETAIYQNGVRTDHHPVNAPPQNTFPIRLGFDSNGQNVFPGVIQRARIYYSALNDAQVMADYLEAKHTTAVTGPVQGRKQFTLDVTTTVYIHLYRYADWVQQIKITNDTTGHDVDVALDHSHSESETVRFEGTKGTTYSIYVQHRQKTSTPWEGSKYYFLGGGLDGALALGPTVRLIAIASEDGADQDYNDAIGFIWWFTSTQ